MALNSTLLTCYSSIAMPKESCLKSVSMKFSMQLSRLIIRFRHTFVSYRYE